MKKAIVIGLGIFAIFIIYFFVCDHKSTPQKGDALMLGQPSGGFGGSTTREGDSAADEEREGDQGKGAARQAAPNTITFVANGERYTYPALMNFRLLHLQNDMHGFLCNFARDLSGIDLQNPATYQHVVSLFLPPDAKATVYTQENEKFIFEFFGSETGTKYHPKDFTFTINEWGGPRGRAKGTFSGELSAEGSGVSMTVENGSFDVGIQ